MSCTFQIYTYFRPCFAFVLLVRDHINQLDQFGQFLVTRILENIWTMSARTHTSKSFKKNHRFSIQYLIWIFLRFNIFMLLLHSITCHIATVGSLMTPGYTVQWQKLYVDFLTWPSDSVFGSWEHFK